MAEKENPFHEHLKHCTQCRTKPFDLCPLGGELAQRYEPEERTYTRSEVDAEVGKAVVGAYILCDKITADVGLEHLDKPGETAWGACDESGHRIRALIPTDALAAYERDVAEKVAAAMTTERERREKEPAAYLGLCVVGNMLRLIPILNAQGWNRYDTDDEHVLHVWADGKSYDVRVPKDEHLHGAAELFDKALAAKTHSLEQQVSNLREALQDLHDASGTSCEDSNLNEAQIKAEAALATPDGSAGQCSHERLDTDGICISCGADKRGIG